MPIRTAISRLLGRAATLAGSPAGSARPRRRLVRGLAPALVGLGLLGGQSVLAQGYPQGSGYPQVAPQGPGYQQPVGGLPPGATVPGNYQPNYAGSAMAPPQAGPMGRPATTPAMGPPPGMMSAPPMGSPIRPVGYVSPAAPPVGGPQANGPAGLYAPGAAGNPNVHPYPQISPFEPFNRKQTTHLNRQGLWFKDTAMKGRRYRGTVDGVWFRFSGSDNDLIGSPIIPLEGNQIWLPTAPTFRPDNSRFVGGTQTDNDIEIPDSNIGDVFTQLPPGVLLFSDEPRVFPYPFLSEDDSPGTGADLVTTVLNRPLFPVRTTDDITGDEHATGGLRLTWGFDEADGTGFEISAFVSGETNEKFEQGIEPNLGFPGPNDGIAGVSPETTGLIDPTIFGLPLNTSYATFPGFEGRNIVGFTQKYDLYTRLTQATQAHGANFVVLNKVIAKRPNGLVRMGFGADYIGVMDEFGFFGTDSGRSYEIDSITVQGGIVQGGGGAGGGGAGGGQGGGGITIEGDVDFAAPVLADFPDRGFNSRLDASTDSYLAGPSFSLRYEAGGDTLRISGESGFSLLINHERTRISGFGIGEQTAMKTLYGIDFLNNDDGTARDTSFSDEASHTHLSPMFKQQVKADLNVVEVMPFLKKLHLTENTRLSAAYQLSYINRMQRASAAIDWRGFPNFPTARASYDDFYMHEFRLGLTMEY